MFSVPRRVSGPHAAQIFPLSLGVITPPFPNWREEQKSGKLNREAKVENDGTKVMSGGGATLSLLVRWSVFYITVIYRMFQREGLDNQEMFQDLHGDCWVAGEKQYVI